MRVVAKRTMTVLHASLQDVPRGRSRKKILLKMMATNLNQNQSPNLNQNLNLNHVLASVQDVLPMTMKRAVRMMNVQPVSLPMMRRVMAMTVKADASAAVSAEQDNVTKHKFCFYSQ